MALVPSIVLCGIVALAFWTAIGFPLCRRIIAPLPALALAPAVGWATHSVIALPLFSAIGFNRPTVVAGSVLLLAASALLMRGAPTDDRRRDDAVPLLAFALAALVSWLPAAAIVPKFTADAVTLSPAIFDHSKVAIVNEMVRLGLPPGNPFFGGDGQGAPLVYYYLWHFSAAEIALAMGVSGWEADAALTGVTAFFSLCVMMGFASHFAGRRAAAWVPLLAFVGSLRPILDFIFGTEAFEAALQRQTGLAGWLFQSAWAPQHIASATCALIAIFLIVEIARRPSPLLIVVLALMAAAGYQSSVWIGGFLFAIAAPITAIALLANAATGARRFLVSLAIAACFTLILSIPFIRDQVLSATQRGNPLAFSPYEVFGDGFPDNLRRVLDIPGYWLVFLPLEFPAIFIPGFLSLISSARRPPRDTDALGTRVFFLLALTSLIVAGFCASTLSDNNDLAWRAALPGIFLLIVFSAIGLSHWISAWRAVAAGALALAALGLPQSYQLTAEYLRGDPDASDRTFPTTPALWTAVRQQTGPADRIANNPWFLEKMTPWSINISWALLSDRRSCFAGEDYLIPFSTLSRDAIEGIGNQFRRIFGGNPQPGDIRDLSLRYHCRIVVLTPQDGAWQRDPFIGSPYYSLVVQESGWRIYLAAAASAQ